MSSSPDEQVAKMVAQLKSTTGRNIDEWLKLTRASGKAKHGELVSWLKAEHGITHGYANLISHQTFRSDSASMRNEGEDLVGAMFTGEKAALRPIFDALLQGIHAFGGDIEESPKKGYLSLRRKAQFATLHPSTKTRLDLGLKLKGVEPIGRLEAAGSWNAMMSHRVRIAEVREVDAEVLAWLRKAYDSA